jgi:hypothetical protein
MPMPSNGMEVALAKACVWVIAVLGVAILAMGFAIGALLL